MSLITRCPACGTMFKVVADQLKISQGWVRCGHCADVFDATIHLQSSAAPAPDAWNMPLPEDAMPPRDSQGAPVPPVAADADAAPRLLRKSADEPSQVPDAPLAASAAPLTSSAPRESASAQADLPAIESVEAHESPPDAGANDDLEDEEMARAKRAVRWDFPSSQVDPDLPVAPEPAIDPLPEVSFVREARRNAFWNSGRLRAAMAATALLLAFVLMLQVALQRPANLAARYPSARPALQWLCAIAGCEFGALRRIDAIVIDSSSFNKAPDGSYRLGIVLKNTADVALAMPALELTLTDTRDQALLRRVLMPAEFGAGASPLEARGQYTGALAFTVLSDGDQPQAGTSADSPQAEAPPLPTTPLPITGYRVLAFYP